MSVWVKLRKQWNPKSKEIANEHDQRIIHGAGLYHASNEPADIMRINAGANSMGVFDTAIDHPAIPIPAHTHIFTFDNDYNVNTTNTLREGAVGSGTSLSPQDARGGCAAFATAGLDNDFYQYNSKYEFAKVTSGKHIWFWGAFKASDVTQSDIIFGLGAVINGRGTIDATHNVFDTGVGNRLDFIGFRKDDGDAQLDVECRKDGTATSGTNVLALANNTDIFVGFHVVSTTKVEFFAGTSLSGLDNHVATITTNLPDDEELAFIFGLRNGDANAKAFYVYKAVILQDV